MSSAEQRKILEDLMVVVNDQIEAIERLRMSISEERADRKEAIDDAFTRLTKRLDDVSSCCDGRWLETNQELDRVVHELDPLRGGFWTRLKWLVMGQ